MKLLRLTTLLFFAATALTRSQEGRGDTPAPGELPAQADNAAAWFAEANRVYDYGKNQQTAQNYSEAARAFNACVPLFERFARTYPNHPDAALAYYRSGVANILIGERAKGEAAFLETLAKTRKRGRTAGLAAFRLGGLAYNDALYQAALPYFAIAAREMEKPDQRHQAMNYQARSLLELKRIPEAARVLQAIVDSPDEPNAYREQSRLALAHIDLGAERLEKAFAAYKELSLLETSEAGLLEVKAQAIVYGGMTAMRMGKTDEGLTMLTTALETFGLPDASKAEAQLTLMQHEFEQNQNYEQVQALFRKGPFDAARPETAAEILLYGGRASAKLGHHNAAVEMFIGVDRTLPNSPLAFEASYRKLLSYYEMRGSNVPELANAFVELYKNKYPKNPRIQLARMMKAETYFSLEDFKNATEAWERVNFSLLPEEMQSIALFKSGWALVENEDYSSAIGLLSEFISRHPESEFYLEAIAKRAQSYLGVGDRVSALSDCERILAQREENPSLASFALQLSGRLYRQEGRTEEMLAAYQDLLSNYDDLSQDTVARAHYNMGLGYFDREEFESALDHLDKARKMVPEFYEDPAGTTMALCYYRLKDASELSNTVTRLYAVNPRKTMPRRLLVWLGLQMYEKSNFTAADHYLSYVQALDEEGETEIGVWKALAKSRLEIPGQEGRALDAIAIILEHEDDPFWRCDAFLDKAHAHLAMAQWDEAEIAALRGLDLDPQGTVKAGLHLTMGDIFLARGDYSTAASSYVRASELFLSDANIQPLALYKAAWSFKKAGNTSAAEAFEERLRLDHPDWQAPERFNVIPGSAQPQTETAQEEPASTDLPPDILPISN
ncbi:tetratricopeptide repeat protein [Roseibacillus ishigakijimensis]|uniref:Tetratricopeptide repeat protein n=1 Tax=Roseibacillus ishigakijimensis TaxID=454146 RepID=A0A934VM68_9BACT|nr:tetratricopeptide repeat protein [Roseibacillus ishigakijimensis]MBK1835429.1 tetratricopeptide repeat protein [Roseibacillus ishigakijimensis]